LCLGSCWKQSWSSLDTLDKNDDDGSYENGFHEAEAEPESVLKKQSESFEQTLQREMIAVIFPVPKKQKKRLSL